MSKRSKKQIPQKNKQNLPKNLKRPMADRVDLMGLLLMVFVVVALVFYEDDTLLTGHHLLIKSYVASVFISLVVIWIVLHPSYNLQLSLPNSIGSISLLGLCLLGGLSLIWSVNPEFSIHKGLMWFNAILLFSLAIQLNKIQIQHLLIGLFVMAVVLTMLGISQYFGWLQLISQSVVPAATFSNKNFAAQVMILLAPLGLYVLTISQRKQFIYLSGISIALILVFMFYTQTRAIWLALGVQVFVGVLLIGLFKIKNIFWSKHHFFSVFLVAMPLFFVMVNLSPDGSWQPFWDVINDKVNTTLADGGDSGRFGIWASAYQMWLNNPFLGSGLGAFFDNMSNGGYDSFNTKGTQRAHNDLIELGVELGFFGLILFVGIVIGLITSFFKHMKNTDCPILLLVVMLALVGSFVNSLFSSPYQHFYPTLLFALYSAIILGWQKPTVQTKTIQTKVRFMIVIMVITIAIVQIGWHHSVVRSYQKATNYIINVANGINQPIALKPWINTPDFATSRRSFLEGLFGNGKYQAVIFLAEDILKSWQNNHTALFRISSAYIELKQYKKADIYLERLKKISPIGDYRGHTNQMVVWLKTGQIDKLKLHLFALANINPNHLNKREDTYRMLFLLGLNIGLDEQKILHFYQQYNQYFPRKLSLEVNLANYYLTKKQIKKAIAPIKQALLINPNITQFKQLLQIYEKSMKK